MLRFYVRTDGGDVRDEAPFAPFEWTTDPGDREFMVIECEGEAVTLTSPGRVFHSTQVGL